MNRLGEMTADVDIRFAAADDIDAIHAIEISSFPAPWRRDFFESELRASGRFNLVGKRSGKVIAYLFSMWFFDEMHINKIAVVEIERRKGVAAALMDECLSFARTKDLRTISLEVRKSNQGAFDFYRQLDFTPMYVRPRYYPGGEAAVVMTRILT